MKNTSLLIALTLVGGVVHGQVTSTTIPPTTVARSVTIQLGGSGPIAEFTAFAPPSPPTTIQAGTHLQILAPAPAATNGPVEWHKGNERLSLTGATLDLASVTPADSGDYSAFVKNADGTTSQSAELLLLVTERSGPRLVNVSTRAHIDANQRSFVDGFVVEGQTGATLVLIRAIGPALASFGVKDPLAAPDLHVYDARGQQVQPWTHPAIETVAPLLPDFLPWNTGAFPLPPASKDRYAYYVLPGGSYTAELSSADGGSGTALLEIYEVPR